MGVWEKWPQDKVRFPSVFSVRCSGAVLKSSPCVHRSRARLGVTSCHTSAFLFIGCRQNFQAPRPHFVLLPRVPALGRAAFQSHLVIHRCTSCLSALRACQLYGHSRVGACGRGAAGTSSANENHLASCLGQTEARWRSQEGHRAGAWSSVLCPVILPLSRPLQLQMVACNRHLLQSPDDSRIRGSPIRALASPEDVTQNLEKCQI